METAKHKSEDRLLIAMLSGEARNLAKGKLDLTFDRAVAVAALHAISDDPHLLAHAICHPGHFQYRTIRAMLLAAGTTAEHLEEVIADLVRRQDSGPPIGLGWEATGQPEER